MIMIKDKELNLLCKNLLERLKDNPKSLAFHEPVDYIALGLNDYLDKIKVPMDISTIKTKLDNDKYNNIYEFSKDVCLMFDNCTFYNPSKSLVYKQALDLKKIFKLHFQKIEQVEIGKRPVMPEKIKCVEILKTITNEKYVKFVWPFLEPVNAKQVPTYYGIIKNPMDLQTMQQKLEENVYEKYEDFLSDLNLIIENCKQFNDKDNEVYACGMELKGLIDRLVENKSLKSDEVHEKIKKLKFTMEKLQNEIIDLEMQLISERKAESEKFHTSYYSMEERIRLSGIVSQLDEENSTKVAKIIHNFDSSFDIFNRNYIQIDFKLLKDPIVKEIDEFLNNIGVVN